MTGTVRRVAGALALAGAGALGACAGGSERTYVGVLRSGYAGIGGEHTGWMLRPAAGDPIEVDVSRVSTEALGLVGTRVSITGEMTEKGYVERGPTRVLVAERIQPADRP